MSRMTFGEGGTMYMTLNTKMICSKCKSNKIVAPCNEPDVEFRCLECGHEKRRIKTNPYSDKAYHWHGKDTHTIEI